LFKKNKRIFFENKGARNGVKKWDKIELYWDSLISKPELQ